MAVDLRELQKAAARFEEHEKAAGFILTQKDEIAEHGMIEEINFGTYKKKSIAEIEEGTGLRFPELRAVDTFRP